MSKRRVVGSMSEWSGILKDFFRQVDDGSIMLEQFKGFVTKTKNKFLKLISDGENLVLDATDGTRTLAKAKDVFDYIDSDFKNWSTDEQGQPTAETPVDVYEMTRDASFSQMFGGLNKFCLEQHQIINFVEKYRRWLQIDGYGTFFLFESKGNFFVANVYMRSDGRLHASVTQFEYSHVWHAESHHRVVVPKLAI